MKQILLFIFLSFIVTRSMAQENTETYSDQNKVATKDSILLMNHEYSIKKMQYELGYVRTCLRKCHNEKMNGYFLSFFGGVVMGLSTTLTETNVSYNGQKTTDFSTSGSFLLIGGAGMSLLGTIMIIDSEKWLKRAYLGPDGLGVKFEF